MRVMSRCFTWFPISGKGEPLYITPIGLFYKEVGSLRKYSLVILDVSETLFSDLWGFRIYGDFAEILK